MSYIIKYSSLLFLGLCLLAPVSRATIITVDNSANSGAPYQNLQVAADNASSGDTLHIIGTNTSYGNVILNRPLTLIGAGYNPPNQFSLPTTITNLVLDDMSVSVTAAGSKLMGLIISTVTWGNGPDLANVTVERCRITTLSIPANIGSGWVVQNNIINTLSIGFNSNCIIRNNILTAIVSSSDEPSVLISNNIFTANNPNGNAFSNIQNATIANNIFYHSSSPQGCQFSTFNNNITFTTANNTLPYGNNSGGGNLVNIDPQFTNAPANGFDYAYDYRLLLGSAGKNAGTDGTDIGIYGSVNPFPIGGPSPHLTSAGPAIPQIIELNILNANISQGMPLNINLKARKQQ